MNHILFDLEHNRSRLDYFNQLREKTLAAYQAAGSRAKTTPHDKWIEIYSDRVAKLERQMTKAGLKIQLKAPTAAERRA